MSSIKRLKCIYLGFGNHAQKYADTFKFLNIKISAILVRKEKNYQQLKQKYNVDKVYKNLNKILKLENYDFIMVMLPWYLIDKEIIKIIKLSKSKYIFSEKPICLSEKKLVKIISASKEFKKKLFVLYNRRSYHTFDYIKKFLSKNKIQSFDMQISENEQKLIKRHSKKIIGNIKYHLTSHWIDIVMWLLNIKKFNLKKIDKSYQLINSKNIKINIDYLGKKPITMNFNFKSMKLKTITLEKIYLEKKGKMKLILNENKINKFKPGLLNLTKNIVKFVSLKKQNDLIPNVNSLKNLYKTLSLLKK